MAFPPYLSVSGALGANVDATVTRMDLRPVLRTRIFRHHDHRPSTAIAADFQLIARNAFPLQQIGDRLGPSYRKLLIEGLASCLIGVPLNQHEQPPPSFGLLAI